MAITTVKDLVEYVDEGLSVDSTALPKVASAVWQANPNTQFKIEVGKASGFDPYTIVVAIFHNDDTIRVYCWAARVPEPKPEGWIIRPPTRYTLTKAGGSMVGESMLGETMGDELIDEWTQVAEEMSSADAEREAIIAYVAGLDDVISKAQLIADLNDEVHHDVDDDEDSADTQTEPDATPGQAPSATPATEVTATS